MRLFFILSVFSGALLLFVNSPILAGIISYRHGGGDSRPLKIFKMDEKVVHSRKKPDFFSNCKTEKESKDTVGFQLEFHQDRLNEELQIINNKNEHVAYVKIKYRKSLSPFEHEDSWPLHLPPNSQNVYQTYAYFGIGKKAKITSLRGFTPTSIFCEEKFSKEEMQKIDEQKAAEKKATEEQIENQRIATQKQKKIAQKQKKILTNCIADKLPARPDPVYKKSILSICKRASENPTLWNKIWYDYFGQ